MAAEADKPASDAVGTGLDSDDKDLTPEEKAAKEGRKACKVDVCRAFYAKETAGKNIACHVIKGWRKESLVPGQAVRRGERSVGGKTIGGVRPIIRRGSLLFCCY
jgi:hypothetical protein